MTTLSLAQPQNPFSLPAMDREELIGFCPACKTFETIYFSEDRLLQTRKFRQEGTRVYHDCGTDKPCRLYRIV